ncbi:MAG TPA: hypothetical protein VGR56_07280 [Nitrososphaerales archaeon]|nr:hypothetical protein [Nitrososphaerales archaeon]
MSTLGKMRIDLLRAARAKSKVTYGELMKRYHLSRGRPLIQAIGQIDLKEYERGAPGFAAIIVRRDTGFPGGGYFCDDDLPPGLRRNSASRTDPKLTPAEKAYVLRQQKIIWAHYTKTQ